MLTQHRELVFEELVQGWCAAWCQIYTGLVLLLIFVAVINITCENSLLIMFEQTLIKNTGRRKDSQTGSPEITERIYHCLINVCILSKDALPLKSPDTHGRPGGCSRVTTLPSRQHHSNLVTE